MSADDHIFAPWERRTCNQLRDQHCSRIRPNSAGCSSRAYPRPYIARRGPVSINYCGRSVSKALAANGLGKGRTNAVKMRQVTVRARARLTAFRFILQFCYRSASLHSRQLSGVLFRFMDVPTARWDLSMAPGPIRRSFQQRQCHHVLFLYSCQEQMHMSQQPENRTFYQEKRSGRSELLLRSRSRM